MVARGLLLAVLFSSVLARSVVRNVAADVNTLVERSDAVFETAEQFEELSAPEVEEAAEEEEFFGTVDRAKDKGGLGALGALLDPNDPFASSGKRGRKGKKKGKKGKKKGGKKGGKRGGKFGKGGFGKGGFGKGGKGGLGGLGGAGASTPDAAPVEDATPPPEE